MYKCSWSKKSSVEEEYHDKEWGVPVLDDVKLFEMLLLETAQAGLSWQTILVKRDNYRKAYINYDVKKIAKYNERNIERLLVDEGIVRNKLKINASINNAKLYLKVQKEYGSFCNYLWSFVDYKQIDNKTTKEAKIPVSTELSDTISKDLKKKGFKFIGTTTIYAYIQSVGLVNDHVKKCHRYEIVNKLGKKAHNKLRAAINK